MAPRCAKPQARPEESGRRASLRAVPAAAGEDAGTDADAIAPPPSRLRVAVAEDEMLLAALSSTPESGRWITRRKPAWFSERALRR